MSVLDVIATVRDCLQDGDVGLVAQVSRVIPSSENPTRIRLDFNFVKWKLAGVPQTATQPNVMLRPRVASTDIKQGNLRDSVVTVEIGIEFFDADVDVIQENVLIAWVALVRVIDELREYSDTHGGTIIDVLKPINVSFGEFEGAASSGFLSYFSVEERSANE